MNLQVINEKINLGPLVLLSKSSTKSLVSGLLSINSLWIKSYLLISYTKLVCSSVHMHGYS